MQAFAILNLDWLFSTPLSAVISTLPQRAAEAGPIVIALLALSIIALTVAIFKAVQFLSLGIGHERRGIVNAVQHWRAGRQAEALRQIQTQRSRPAAFIQTAMDASNGHRPLAIVREDIEAEALAYLAALRSRLPVLEAASQLAPLIGLFGTVIGMMSAFQALQSAGAEADPAALAGGIWTALITTAVGLAVAIPAALALYWFEGRLAREQTFIETAVTRVLTTVEPQPTSIEVRDAAE